MTEYVYIISNKSYRDNYLKIGYTTNHPEHRLKQLYKSESVPTPFIIEFIIITDNAYQLEQKIHRVLNSYRVNASREFFNIEKHLLRDIVEQTFNIKLVIYNSELNLPDNSLNISKKKILPKYIMTFNLKDYIKSKRPNLSAGSLATYNSILKNLYGRMNNGEKNDIDVSFFSDKHKEILNYLKDIEPMKRKTTLSALVVVCDDDVCHYYRDPMLKDIQTAKSISISQSMTEKEAANWVSQQDVREKFDSLYDALKVKLVQKKIEPKTLTEFSDLLLLALTSGIYIPPRRSLDWTEMKVRGYDKKTDNYIMKGKFYLNRYKTDKTYGLEVIDIPAELQTLLKKYISYLPSSQEYLFVNNKGAKINSVKVALTLNKIFGKNVSINALRHSYITEKYKNMPALKELLETSKDMGHSVLQHLEYIKN